MLTRLRVQGFKNLHDVEVRFGPLTCIAGANGAGKSNLFAAIRFLHLLSKHPIMEAARLLDSTADGRLPELGSLFTALGGNQAPEIRFSADLVVNREVEDALGVSARAAISSVRYTVAIGLDRNEERLVLTEESLLPIPLSDGRKRLGFEVSEGFSESIFQGRRAAPFISTFHQDDDAWIRVHQEGNGGKTLPAAGSSKTMLAGLAASDYPTLLAVHHEMAAWQTLLLEPSAMRQPSHYSDPPHIDGRGGSLPAALARLGREEARPGSVYAELGNRLAEIIEGVRAVRIRDDETNATLTLELMSRDGTLHTARSLSDGALRFAVLAVVEMDPEATGVVCLEEPENGIHPRRIPALMDLVRDIAVDPSFPVGPDNPFRQVVINTHSPAVIGNVKPDELVLFRLQRIHGDKGDGQVACAWVPETSWRAQADSTALKMAPGHLIPYFATGVDEAWQNSLASCGHL
ncbi:MAG: AAA family ATPase [bacterium]|nr:AAA family ATPase [bacterium]